ncbi:hypothetical protein Kole_0791 [Kosmotoga olearia TBF 19.5.1]|jgi:hypothetical protein|uniref:Uncharacterized protein n=1 Tax=Kosmotoga olearia (strain ATCC BAA-1733 / DSM 21960 / TBF 19.5.1) TaxID=521045 RepID=C5CG61_KOSOT|nr:hypothetical protein Kole_0791 [Kosmotoga olearia TBF 19.5.1]
MKTLPMKNASFSDEIRHLLYWKLEKDNVSGIQGDSGE